MFFIAAISIINFNFLNYEQGTPNVDLYAEVLKWQKDMQTQRIYLTKNVLANNLEQIAQVYVHVLYSLLTICLSVA